MDRELETKLLALEADELYQAILFGSATCVRHMIDEGDVASLLCWRQTLTTEHQAFRSGTINLLAKRYGLSEQ